MNDRDVMPLRTQAAFPKAARLLKTDEFSSVFRLRPWRRTEHFVVYGRPTGNAARLGLVIGKKFAPRAVTRNLVRRIAREAFRVRRAQFEGFDLLLRLHTKFDRKALPGASSPGLKALCRGEIETLLEKAAREVTRRGASSATSERTPCATPAPASAAQPARDQAGKDSPPDQGTSQTGTSRSS
ncbi:MAG TPA: ribonuclease P protein component [Paraburkholderia sp.]|uniref:ribonuclease P protein component n=1 Tax=Paraburkholderia sp. TaxID=1926495 RepID=UPI002C4593C5|nr:ribonuclease P protein component [Paraburkholderia sp.]HTR07718.1 ribonuclease P protein component [Paraburkholderia sp.]